MPLTLSNDEYTEFRNTWENMKHVIETQEAELKKHGEASQEVKNTIATFEGRMQTFEQKLQEGPPKQTNINTDELFDPYDYKYAECYARGYKFHSFRDGHELEPLVTPQTLRMEAFKKALRNGYGHLSKEEKEKIPQVSGGWDMPNTPGFSQKTLTVTEDTTGGFFAPPEFDTTILKGLVLYSPMRDAARVRTTSARSVQMGKRTGVISAAWTAEKKTRTVTEGFSVGRIEIPTHEMYSLVKISEQDLEDPVIDIEAEIRLEMSEQFGVAENKAYLLGDGIMQPEGILSNGDITIVKAGSTTAVSPDKLITMQYDLPSAYAANAKFYMSRQIMGVLRLLKYTIATDTYIWQPGLQNGAPPTLLGDPYVEFPDMATTIASAGLPIMYGDMGKTYVVVQRVGMAFKRLAERWAEDAVIGVYARMRVGGQVVLPQAMRFYQMST